MLKQFVPNEICLKCDACCRFAQQNSRYAPVLLSDSFSDSTCRLSLKPHKDIFICQNFSPESNSCNIYAHRPLDCQLYPFMVTYNKEYENIVLVLDAKCPYAKVITGHPEFNYTSLPHSFVMPYQPDTIKITTIKNLGGFKALALEHKPLFNKYLNNSEYSARSFVNIYIWSDLFNILWKIIDNNLCVFYEYKNEFNMLISSPKGMHLLKPGGRIENIAEKEIKAFEGAGIKIHKNTDEYIYLAKDIAELKGNRFSSQRAAKNNFIKNNKFIYRPFVISDIDECLNLYSSWAKRKMGTHDSVYHQLIADSFSAHKKAMLDYEELGLTGRVVDIDEKIRAYTFAFEMNTDTYCVVFETADTTIKGLSQFIFSHLAQDIAKEAKYINTMDDSGLANLKKAKLSWHPHRTLTSYIGTV
ncbi:MAG: hypothetical protein COY77_00390 [Candidatus Omnitrophica bacterium CG_4_10_14_0_8_um_filter_43_18]|nr:MAG: hypothetical protein COY77_00390 [Candidatus Omnitrophica bacterium CG_4_10_14_0_8_um_filter_43_18]